MAVDPTYPLLPIANILCATLLFILLVINFVRRSQAFNLPVNILSFCLFWTTLFTGINMVIWANDSHLDFPFAYCDVVSHMQVFTSIARPACTLLITRQLNGIVTMSPLDGFSHTQRRRSIMFELALGLCLPAFVTGVLYYIAQPTRFEVLEGFGCVALVTNTGYTLVFVQSWTLVFPLYSGLVYCPRIVYFLMRRERLHARLFRARSSTLEAWPRVHNNDGFRLLILGCLDLCLSLPLAALHFGYTLRRALELGSLFTFYEDWAYIHQNWAPSTAKYAMDDPIGLLQNYIPSITSVVLGFVVFALFGCTTQARAMYARFFWTTLRFGRRRVPECCPSTGGLPPMVFVTVTAQSHSASIDSLAPTPIIAIPPTAAIFNFTSPLAPAHRILVSDINGEYINVARSEEVQTIRHWC
ncbi:unnamed protein product [Peniophora sp. CBMAI 1063]|nr:unnamed protein product [Peniophora sp. CBMAI 1063]